MHTCVMLSTGVKQTTYQLSFPLREEWLSLSEPCWDVLLVSSCAGDYMLQCARVRDSHVTYGGQDLIIFQLICPFLPRNAYWASRWHRYSICNRDSKSTPQSKCFVSVWEFHRVMFSLHPSPPPASQNYTPLSTRPHLYFLRKLKWSLCPICPWVCGLVWECHPHHPLTSGALSKKSDTPFPSSS